MISPVLFIVFNRPDTTIRVFNEIRKAKPSRLYVAADGPRSEKIDDESKCQKVRDIVSQIDWECQVKHLYRDKNVGCKMAVSTAIDWFFSHEEEGIILEDDCLPSESYFVFCDKMLEKFRDDQRVFLISGYNKKNKWKNNSLDYFFSYYGGIWGWASWRRAWKHNDIEMKSLNDFIDSGKLIDLLGKKQGLIRAQQLRNVLSDSRLSAWDYQWGYSRHINSGMACVPSVSLVENIGIGPDATHTFAHSGIKVTRHEINLPIRENRFIVVDRDYDDSFFQSLSSIGKLKLVISRIIKHSFRSLGNS